MSYTPTEWKTGDIVSSQKLNKLENGVANAGGLVITATVSGTTTTLDKTWQEIHDALANGVPCVVVGSSEVTVVTMASIATMGGENLYTVAASETYLANTPSDYPAYGDDIG